MKFNCWSWKVMENNSQAWYVHHYACPNKNKYNIYYLHVLTESEVITGKSQTGALMY